MESRILDDLAAVSDPKGLVSDLMFVFLWTVAALLWISIEPLSMGIIRILLVLPLILFFPGYVLVAAFFPRRKDIEIVERIGLSFGLSIAVVSLIGFAMNFTPWGITLGPVLMSLIGFTVGMEIIAVIRRIRVRPNDRFIFPFSSILHEMWEVFSSPNPSRADRLLSIILVLCIIATILVTFYIILVPIEGEKFTEFYILGSKGKAADYPQTITVGESNLLIIGIGNHEYRPVTYTVECYLMNVTFDPITNESSIKFMNRIDQFSLDISHNSTSEVYWNFIATMTEYNRLELLLFDEEIPPASVIDKDRINASYRDLHLWIQPRPRTV